MIISIANQKGGVGKTTFTVNLAHYLSQFEAKGILVVDSDPQHSALDWSEVRDIPAPFEVVSMVKKTIHRDLPRTASRYGMTLIDCPPRTTDVVRSAIMASDMVIVPVTPSPYDIWASQETVDLIKEARIFNEKLKYVFAFNRVIPQTVIAEEAKQAIKELAVFTLDSFVTQRVIFAESATEGKTVFDYQPSKAQHEIINLGNEVQKWLRK